MRVVAASRTARAGDAKASFGEAAGDRLWVREADVSDLRQAQTLIAFAEDSLGGIDVLVNAAGTYGAIGRVEDVSPDAWKAAFDINLMGCYSCCHHALRGMIAARRGRIVNVAGGGSTGPLENFSCYAASKAALARFTDTLAREVEPAGIMVNAILPGTVDSPMQDQLLAAGERAGGWYPKMKEMRESGKGFVPVSLTAELVDFLLFGAGRNLSGKLLSARYDGFGGWSEAEIAEVSSSELFTLRRMDIATLKSIFDIERGIQRFDKK
jgi:3-oxoacyl-[acyl-carrier protein] reductase